MPAIVHELSAQKADLGFVRLDAHGAGLDGLPRVSGAPPGGPHLALGGRQDLRLVVGLGGRDLALLEALIRGGAGRSHIHLPNEKRSLQKGEERERIYREAKKIGSTFSALGAWHIFTFTCKHHGCTMRVCENNAHACAPHPPPPSHNRWPPITPSLVDSVRVAEVLQALVAGSALIRSTPLCHAVAESCPLHEYHLVQGDTVSLCSAATPCC